VRESIPTEAIIRAYLDESVEQEEEVTIEPIPEETPLTVAEEKDDDVAVEIPPEEPPPETVPTIQDIDTKPVITRLAFNDVDEAFGEGSSREEIVAPKNIERLEEISSARNLQRKLEEEGDDEDDGPLDRIKINEDSLDLGDMGIMDLNAEEPLSLDFEEIM
jgi:hypothetical protein